MPVNGLPPYDTNNIFARILRGEIPNDTVRETAHTLAINDIHPQAPVHVLVVPKGRYVSIADFSREASEAEIAGFWRAVGHVAHELGLEADGFRALINAGHRGGQEVPHLHVHLFGGKALGPMLARA